MQKKQEEKCSITRMTHDWANGECIPEPPPTEKERKAIAKVLGISYDKSCEELYNELTNKY